ncbi:MAG: hypothetical protein AAGD86_06330, partial [Pseudomonadota bacterium]
MRLRTLSLAAAAGVLIAGGALADTLSIDRSGADSAAMQSMPNRGMTMRRVEAAFGAPVRRVA